MEEKYFSSTEEQIQIENRSSSLNQNQIHHRSYNYVYSVLNRNLHNIIFSPLNPIRNLQSIGRGLRLSDKEITSDIPMIYPIKKKKLYLGILRERKGI